MSTSILVGYATSYGSTGEVAEVIGEVLVDAGFTVDVMQAREARSLEGYGAVVLGAPLYMFRWHKDAHRFLKKHRQALVERPAAVFALGPVHDPHDEEEWQDSWRQLNKALASYEWFKPVTIEMFGGRFDPEVLRFPLQMFAAGEPATDIRDWAAINEWARNLPSKLA